MPKQIIPQPDGKAIAEVVRERFADLTQRRPQPTLDELNEIARLYQLPIAHIVYIQGTRHALA